MKMKLLLSALLVGAALGAWARYKPANLDSLPDLPAMSNGCVTLTAPDYQFSGLREIKEDVQSGMRYGALRINGTNKTVTIWIKTPESRLVLTGADGDPTYGGGAGLYLPSDQTLILRYVGDPSGTPTITATGGAGKNAGCGQVRRI